MRVDPQPQWHSPPAPNSPGFTHGRGYAQLIRICSHRIVRILGRIQDLSRVRSDCTAINQVGRLLLGKSTPSWRTSSAGVARA